MKLVAQKQWVEIKTRLRSRFLYDKCHTIGLYNRKFVLLLHNILLK